MAAAHTNAITVPIMSEPEIRYWAMGISVNIARKGTMVTLQARDPAGNRGVSLDASEIEIHGYGGVALN